MVLENIGANNIGEAGVVEHNSDRLVFYVSLTLIKPKIELLDSWSI